MKRGLDLLPNSFIFRILFNITGCSWRSTTNSFFTANNAAGWAQVVDAKSKQINKAKAFFYRVISFLRSNGC